MGIRRLSRIVGLVAVLFAGLLLHTPGARADAAWFPAAPPATNHAGATATLLPDGQVLLAGDTTAERYDPATDRWSPAGALTTYRTSHTATPLPDGRVLVAGGFALYSTGTAAAELYDPATNAWTATAAMTTARVGHSATPLRDGRVLVVGGSADARNTGLATAELFDPATGAWTPAGTMATTRALHTATLLRDDRVLVAGGMPTVGGVGGTMASAELYDPAADTWAPTGTMGAERVGQRDVALPDGRVLVTGGTNERGFLGTTELYDPATDAWAPAAAMTTPRFGHTATLLPSGRVLVAGGNPPAANATTELYDPASGRWTPSAPMSSGRGYTATLLPDGQVLVVGESLAERYAEDAPPPPQQCFAETGHCVRGRFLAYWQAHGGQAHIVQYFERARLEYHPRNAPPYDVLLGQFGRRILAGVPDAPTAPAAPREGYAFFEPTGHNVGPRFFAYWEANGGLAQFGYPLSEEFEERLEDGNIYTVQYFERARFEHHPENAGTPYEVLLGQFGRRALAESGR